MAFINALITFMMITGSGHIGGTINLRYLCPEWFGCYDDIDIFAKSIKSVENTNKNLNSNKNIQYQLQEQNIEKEIQGEKINCQIFLLTKKTEQEFKTEELSLINLLRTPSNNQAEIKENEYYKIRINKSILVHWNENQDKKIEVYKNNTKFSCDLIPLFMSQKFMYQNKEIIIPDQKENKAQNKIKKYYVGSVNAMHESKTTEIKKSIIKNKSYKCISDNVFYLLKLNQHSSDCKIYNFWASNRIKEKITAFSFHSLVIDPYQKSKTIVQKLEESILYLIEWHTMPTSVTMHEKLSNITKTRMEFFNTNPAVEIDGKLFIVL